MMKPHHIIILGMNIFLFSMLINMSMGAADQSSQIEKGMVTGTALNRGSEAVIRALDKVTGRASDINIHVEQPIIFGSLLVTMRICYESDPIDKPESVAFLEIRDVANIQNFRRNRYVQNTSTDLRKTQLDPARTNTTLLSESHREDDNKALSYVDTAYIKGERIFSGWMYASAPGLSALEHPTYDVWVINCTASAPESEAETE